MPSLTLENRSNIERAASLRMLAASLGSGVALLTFSLCARLRLGAAADGDRELHVLSLALEFHLCGGARRNAGHRIEHALRIDDRLAVDRDKHVPGLDA